MHPSDARAAFSKKQPHWVWAVACVVVPLVLLGLGFLGVALRSMVPLAVASTRPLVGPAMAVGGMISALLLRRKVPIQIAGVGLALSGAAFLLLLWVGR